jgi:hypothetical protein
MGSSPDQVKPDYYIVHSSYKGPLWSWSHISWIYIYLCSECLPPLKLWVRIQLMARCIWYNIIWWSLSVTCDRFDQVLLVSSTNKTDCHDITEKLLKVVLNSITPTQPHSSYELYSPKWLFYSQVIEYKKKADDETKIQDALEIGRAPKRLEF